MTTSTFAIHFDFWGDGGSFKICLVANVEIHHSQTYYVVNNFKVPDREGQSLLPEITIRKVKGQWVHIDSGKMSDLSMAAGQAIDLCLSANNVKII